MADAPPYEPPLADEAPLMLVKLLYYLVHDSVPFGVIEHALHRARTEPHHVPNDSIRRYAHTVARELVWQPETPVSP